MSRPSLFGDRLRRLLMLRGSLRWDLAEWRRSWEEDQRVVAVQDVAWRDVFSRTIVEQLVDVAALGSCMKRNAMWHVPQMHPQSPHINYWQNCTEGVWCIWYIGSDIWLQDDFWEASSIGFQSSFSMAIVILRKSWLVFHDRLLLVGCFWRFVLLVWSTVLRCGARLQIRTLTTTGLCCRLCQFFNWGYDWVWRCDLWQYYVCCTTSGVTQCF